MQPVPHGPCILLMTYDAQSFAMGPWVTCQSLHVKLCFCCTLLRHVACIQDMKLGPGSLPLSSFLLDEAGVQQLRTPPWEPRSVKKEPGFERYHEDLFLSDN